ncbi:uncharacterized protein LOC135476837 isoform X2 [Liolophura sinensis]|uniref:uncharacterized protein LOC135476837 isoform X2 n=1 Tax=Liolophura sinensis TaxID=3198878 RepID=UPI003158F1EB
MKRAVTMANVRKALRFSLKGRDYDFLESKENDYFSTPKFLRRQSDKFEMPESERKVLQSKAANAMNSRRSLRLTRSTSVTTSFRDAMGTLKQKIRKSTRRRMRLKTVADSPMTPASLRRSSRIAGMNSPLPKARSEVKLYSPFEIDTPSPKCYSQSASHLQIRQEQYETPGRIRHEVEALTQNMQALATLTPQTLRSRSSSRNIITMRTSTAHVNVAAPTLPHKSPSPVLLTNGSLRPDVQARRRLQAQTPIFV